MYHDFFISMFTFTNYLSLYSCTMITMHVGFPNFHTINLVLGYASVTFLMQTHGLFFLISMFIHIQSCFIFHPSTLISLFKFHSISRISTRISSFHYCSSLMLASYGTGVGFYHVKMQSMNKWV